MVPRGTTLLPPRRPSDADLDSLWRRTSDRASTTRLNQVHPDVRQLGLVRRARPTTQMVPATGTRA